MLLQIVALREQNAHIQRKVASGEGAEDLLEGTDAQKIHGKVGTYSCQALNCLTVVHVFSTVRFCSTNAKSTVTVFLFVCFFASEVSLLCSKEVSYAH